MNRIAVLGSTGSIGTQTLEVARRLRDRIEVVALAGGRNTGLLSRQIDEFRPRLYHSLLPDRTVSGASRLSSLEEMARDGDVDTVVVATSGSAGLAPALEALGCGKKVALANKEALVMAGQLLMTTAARYGGTIMPLDSEHSAIWQCLAGERGQPRRLLLTASGGPFYRTPPARLPDIKAADALAHPVWSMGRKITVDSATLMNKGLEVIEAHHLFGVAFDDIEVLVHPECIVHSLVEFVDGAVKAQLGEPDMVLPIQYALTYPERMDAGAPVLDWSVAHTLSFEPVDEARFPALAIAREAGRQGMTYPAVLCGADEAAVDLFLREEIRFTDIPALVREALDGHEPFAASTVEQLNEASERAGQTVLERCHRRAGISGPSQSGSGNDA